MGEGQLQGVGVDAQQSGRLGWGEVLQQGGAAVRVQDAGVPGAVQDREQQQFTGTRRQGADAGGVQGEKSAGQGQDRGQGGQGGALWAGERGGQFAQRERVAVGLLDQARVHRLGQVGEVTAQELSACLVVQGPHGDDGRAEAVGDLLAAGARGGEHRDVACGQAPGEEPQGGDAGFVQPLHVVDDQ